MKKVCYQLILPTLIVLLISGGAFAADNEILRELQALKQRMVVLEQKLIDQDPMQQPAADVAIAEQETASVRQIVEEVVAASKPAITVGGAVRAQYGVKDWSDASQDKGGDFSFDTFRFDVNGSIGDMILSAQYRFYPEYDFNTIHHGYIGYNFTDDLQGQIGVQQVPFGLQPYASHNFWFSGAYYVGLEDDYDMGIKLLYAPGPLSITAAFYKNGELGDASNAERYSVDVISSGAGNGETNQGNLRVAYLVEHGENASTEIGVSGQYGGIYNDNTGDMGEHWASAVHLNGNYGAFNLQLEYVRYQYNVENPDTIKGVDDDGEEIDVPVDNDIITLGCYGYTWGAPSDADIAIFNLSYSLPVSWGPVSNLTFYTDNTVIIPDESRFEDIWQNVVGMMVTSGPVYTYFDIISGENMAFSGGDMTDPDNERTTRFNMNIGYYF